MLKKNSTWYKSFFEGQHAKYDNVEVVCQNGFHFYNDQDLVYFPTLNAYGAFKYNVVKDILANSKTITVSDVHITLNSVYFSLDEQKHQHNKKSAYKHLEFLSKKLQNETNEFAQKLQHFLKSKFPVNEPFDLTEHLINPLVFTCILEEYGFLEFMSQFNPWSDNYNHEESLKHINNYFEDSNLLTQLLEDYILMGNPIPATMQQFLSEIESDYELDNKLLAQFFASMIFSGTHSTASFLTSYMYTIYSDYLSLLQKPLNLQKLEILESEVLRLYMPVQWIFRTVREDTLYAGVNLKKDDTVILFVGVANLDSTVFEEATSIKFDRKINHLSFGLGPYACIGRFTTHRNAINLLSFLSEINNQITFQKKNDKHFIKNAILRIPLHVIYRPDK